MRDAEAGGATRTASPVQIFFCYSHKDEQFRDELATHLALLRKQGAIQDWHDRRVGAGEEWRSTIDAHLEAADIILLLVSADFVASDYCYDVEMTRAMDRHRSGAARVIAVILRTVDDWQSARFGALRALPTDGKPVDLWPNRDEAWADVTRGIRAAAKEIASRKSLEADDGGPLSTRGKHLEPMYPDAATRLLGEQIERARVRKRALQKFGASTAEVDREILDLRRQMREGGQLKAGDSLGDGRYWLLNQVGRGGFASVWRAQDTERERLVAIKVLHSNLAGDKIRLERFLRGSRTMETLDHDAVVRVLERHGQDGGFHYFVMEFLEGGDLRQAVLEKRASGEEVLRMILRVGDALAMAHDRRFVHRDIKPANILLDATGAPKLTDFDLVGGADTTGGTRTGALGTFLYAAPELMDRPQEADARADVFGLGMTALFGLHGAELPATVVGRAKAFVERLACSDAIKAVLTRAVEWDDRNARFADARSFCEALQRAMERPSVEITKGRSPSDPPAPDSLTGASTLRPAELGETFGIHLRGVGQGRGGGVAPARRPVGPEPAARSPAAARPEDARDPTADGAAPSAPLAAPAAAPLDGETAAAALSTRRFAVGESLDLKDAPVLDIHDAYLIVLKAPEGAVTGVRVRFTKNPARLGRERGNDILVQEDSVSRSHARIELRGFSLFLIDDGSTNGTFVNGKRVAQGVTTMLQDGDRVQVGLAVVFQLLLNAGIAGDEYKQKVARACVDAPTGLHSRRYLDAHLEREVAAARSHKQGLALLLLHPEWAVQFESPGEAAAALGDLGRTLLLHVPHDAVLARFDADDLAVLLPMCTLETALILADTLGQAAASQRLASHPTHAAVGVHVACVTLDEGERDGAAELRKRAMEQLHGTDPGKTLRPSGS